jgi:DNA-binding transcriptional MerR regulator
MSSSKGRAADSTYALRTVVRLTGLSPDLLRAWERRYGVIEPMRTSGGTRRYSPADIERLRLVKAAVDAGHRVGRVAHLDAVELKQRASVSEVRSAGHLDEILAALENLEGAESQRLLSTQLSALGAAHFAREVASPLVREIGERWANGKMGIAPEHLATSVLRSLLGSALQPTPTSLLGPKIVFGTPAGERHELGLLMAALTALGAGANPLYLGSELPVEDLLNAVEGADAAALALSVVTMSGVQAERVVNALRGGLASEVRLWVGGVGASELELPQGVEYMATLEDFEQRVMLEIASP